MEAHFKICFHDFFWGGPGLCTDNLCFVFVAHMARVHTPFSMSSIRNEIAMLCDDVADMRQQVAQVREHILGSYGILEDIGLLLLALLAFWRS